MSNSQYEQTQSIEKKTYEINGESIAEKSNNTIARKAAYQKFEHAKHQCLYGQKRDKSSVGQLDDGVIEICALINEHFPDLYTTSSCAGRCFLYTGTGIKSTTTFHRCRISHTKITDAIRYFDLQTIVDDPTGGGDVIPQLYDGGKRQRQQLRRQQQQQEQQEDGRVDEEEVVVTSDDESDPDDPNETGDVDFTTDDNTGTTNTSNNVWWLRYEPFILHVACRSLHSAITFMNVVRPIFKTVGITSLSSHNSVGDNGINNNTNSGGCPKYVVAVYGDEGLDMPLTNEGGIGMIHDTESVSEYYTSQWLASLVNERHERNASKIDRLVQGIQDVITTNTNVIGDNVQNIDDDGDDEYTPYHQHIRNEFSDNCNENSNRSVVVLPNGQQIQIPRSYDVIGDVAILHTIPNNQTIYSGSSTTDSDNDIDGVAQSIRKAIGETVIQRNKNIKVVVLRSSNLDGDERAPGINGIQILTGPIDRIQRLPLITTHREYGISCIVNIHQTFFTPRMGQERIRICNQIGNQKEHVLLLFAGVCMDAFLIAARTNAISITAIESNDYAMECAQKGHLLLARNKQCLENNAAQRLQIIHGDCLQIIPTLPQKHYHRIVAPRPKEGHLDGDQPPGGDNAVLQVDTDDRIGGSGGREFLIALLSVLRPDGGVCHWYDFCADHEYPQCIRTIQFLSDICRDEYQYRIEIVHIAHVGSIAKRQLRICVDFKVSPCLE